MIRPVFSLVLASTLALSGCAATKAPPPSPDPVAAPAKDALYRPRRVEPGRLEYAPNRNTFAPILTERVAYPTQGQANDAYRRLLADRRPEDAPSSVRLFGCKPGALDPQTARVARLPGPVVHCATDFLDETGRQSGRRTVNFYYSRLLWRMQPVDPPLSLVPWRDREASPNGPWRWVPGRDRYE
ncbi:hypothetical protein [Bradyrhizobium sp. CCGUVB23]|uniref:hypothetical protein n=1 Tax=Bradyrhizobium sp. CCGUVB23 TaxID=2949630 RepID=UPI0020B3B409|nr:hypothetical protein [Bradyrhizobium sp. CCGUVB23]MCP3468566.1 hypothetical protein [Bradyrhizobium sp. CCGUVB23]